MLLFVRVTNNYQFWIIFPVSQLDPLLSDLRSGFSSCVVSAVIEKPFSQAKYFKHKPK